MSDDSGDAQRQLNLGSLNLSVTKQASLVQSSLELCISDMETKFLGVWRMWCLPHLFLHMLPLDYSCCIPYIAQAIHELTSILLTPLSEG